MALYKAFEPVRDKADRLGAGARDTARAARESFDEGRRAVPGLARSAQQALSEGVDQFRSQAKDAADVAGEQLDGARHYVVEHVQDRPLTATVAALGAGFVLGLLFAGSRR